MSDPIDSKNEDIHYTLDSLEEISLGSPFLVELEAAVRTLIGIQQEEDMRVEKEYINPISMKMGEAVHMLTDLDKIRPGVYGIRPMSLRGSLVMYRLDCAGKLRSYPWTTLNRDLTGTEITGNWELVAKASLGS
jgi:hypothetical protein